MFSSTSGQPADDAVVRVLNAFMEARALVYIVGGAVRDHLLGISTVPGWSYQPETRRLPAGIGDCAAASPHPRRGGVTTVDLDLVFSGPVLPVARRVANLLGWAYYPLDEERDVARLIGTGPDGQRLECDVAALRGDLRADLFARDFTVNALALRLSADGPPQLIDLCGGRADLEARRLLPHHARQFAQRSNPVAAGGSPRRPAGLHNRGRNAGADQGQRRDRFVCQHRARAG